jgi:hypothetical protein
MYRHRPGSGPVGQRKKVDLAENPQRNGVRNRRFYFCQLTQILTWEPSQEEERKRREWNEPRASRGVYIVGRGGRWRRP